MNYAEFKDYLATFLWKNTDQDLLNNLDSLILMAHGELNRSLRVEGRHTAATLSVTAQDVPLPSDYYSIRSVNLIDVNRGEAKYVEPSDILWYRERTSSGNYMPVYSLQNKTLMLVCPTDTPFNIIVNYRATVPDFKTTDTSWLADDMLDIYTYAVLKHTAPFLREDARVQLWMGLYTTALNEANEASAHEQQRGVYDAPQLPRDAGVSRGERNASNTLYTK